MVYRYYCSRCGLTNAPTPCDCKSSALSRYEAESPHHQQLEDRLAAEQELWGRKSKSLADVREQAINRLERHYSNTFENALYELNHPSESDLILAHTMALDLSV